MRHHTTTPHPVPVPRRPRWVRARRATATARRRTRAVVVAVFRAVAAYGLAVTGLVLLTAAAWTLGRGPGLLAAGVAALVLEWRVRDHDDPPTT